MTNELTCFKAYDIRGRVPDQLNEDIAYRIGRAYCTYLKPKTVVVGFDIRLTSLQLSNALIDGLTDGGADVINIGQWNNHSSQPISKATSSRPSIPPTQS